MDGLLVQVWSLRFGISCTFAVQLPVLDFISNKDWMFERSSLTLYWGLP